jgi:alpha-glucoside transport system permease protein
MIGRRTQGNGLFWAAPALLLMATFLVWPMLRTIWISLHKGSIIKPTRQFVGVDNYVRLLTNDPLFLKWELPPWAALFNSAVWVVFFTAGVIGFGLLVAVLSDRMTYERLVKVFIFVPIVISFTAASVVFRLVFATDPNVGVVNAMWNGLGFAPIAWLGNENVVNFAIIAAGIWVWTALSMTLLSAAYKGIPQDIREASAVDGATGWQTFWRVSLPMMAPTIAIIAVTMIINALKAVDLVLVMTQGGPGGASRIVGFTVFWEIFNNNKAGYGSAAAVILLILMLPLMWYQLRQSGLEATS